MHINSNPGLLYEKGAIYNEEIPHVKSLQFAGIKLTNSNGSCSHLGLLYSSTAHKFLRCILLSFWKRDLILICSFFLTVAHARNVLPWRKLENLWAEATVFGALGTSCPYIPASLPFHSPEQIDT